MKKLRIMLCAVFTLMLANTTAQADSSNFAGPYVGVTASGYGMQMAGESITGGAAQADQVSLGQVAPITGIELGYVLPLGSAFLVDIGASYFQGEASMNFDDDSGVKAAHNDETELAAKGTVSFKVDDLRTFSIAPTLVLSDTSSLYVKVGLTEADIGVTGDITTPGNLSGTTWALGTRTVLDSGIFVRTEAGYTDYNGISAVGKGSSISTRNSYSANPTIAFGAVSLGFRF